MKPASPSHVFIDKNLSLQNFESFLKTPKSGESKEIFAGKARVGHFLLHRLPNEANGKLDRLMHFLTHGSERQAIRQKIKEFLKSNHLEVTSDIRKALPSRFSSGSAAGLLKAVKAASANAKFIVGSFGKDIEQLDWLNPGSTGALNRGNTITTTAPAALLRQDFSAAAKKIMSGVKQEIETTLKKTQSADAAMLDGYKILIGEVSKLSFSPQFKEVAKGMASEVDRLMQKKLDQESDEGNKKFIQESAKKIKSNIIPSLILRTLTPALFDEIPGYKPPTGGEKIKLTELTEQLKLHFNPVERNTQRQNTQREDFKGFYEYLESEKNIKLKTSMPALRELERDVLKTKA